jgi:hypothetical protein
MRAFCVMTGIFTEDGAWHVPQLTGVSMTYPKPPLPTLSHVMVTELPVCPVIVPPITPHATLLHPDAV